MTNNKVNRVPKTKVTYLEQLRPLREIILESKDHYFLFIVDKFMLSKNPILKKWIYSQGLIYEVSAGEKLKDSRNLYKHLHRIFKILAPYPHKKISIVGLGGGSVGDFSGFIASIFKRGVRLIQMPTTWLAAIDSSHGGKNGLNLGSFKNQIGTFYHPQNVIIIKSLLGTQNKEQLKDAFGEIYKMALLTKESWALKLLNEPNLSEEIIWNSLPFLIKEKYRIVAKDPLEEKGIRQILNLGHTTGHLFELTQKIPHGRAVAIGLLFSLSISYEMKLMKKSHWELLQSTEMFHYLKSLKIKPLTKSQLTQGLLQDKKKTSKKSINFIFIHKIGSPIVKEIGIKELLHLSAKFGLVQ